MLLLLTNPKLDQIVLNNFQEKVRKQEIIDKYRIFLHADIVGHDVGHVIMVH